MNIFNFKKINRLLVFRHLSVMINRKFGHEKSWKSHDFQVQWQPTWDLKMWLRLCETNVSLDNHIYPVRLVEYRKRWTNTQPTLGQYSVCTEAMYAISPTLIDV